MTRIQFWNTWFKSLTFACWRYMSQGVVSLSPHSADASDGDNDTTEPAALYCRTIHYLSRIRIYRVGIVIGCVTVFSSVFGCRYRYLFHGHRCRVFGGYRC